MLEQPDVLAGGLPAGAGWNDRGDGADLHLFLERLLLVASVQSFLEHHGLLGQGSLQLSGLRVEAIVVGPLLLQLVFLIQGT